MPTGRALETMTPAPMRPGRRPTPSWTTLLRAGEGAARVTAALVVFAVGGFFVWPHVFGVLSAEEVLLGIQGDPAGFVMRLDPVVLLAGVTQLPLFLALWVALRATSPSTATLALGFGSLGIAALLPTRPIVELFALARLHAAAGEAGARERYVAAAEALLAQFHGSAWAVGITLGGLAGLAFGAAMLRDARFRRITAWTAIVAGAGSLAFPLPGVGLVLLFVLGTIGSIVWLWLVAGDLGRLRRTPAPPEPSEPLAARDRRDGGPPEPR